MAGQRPSSLNAIRLTVDGRSSTQRSRPRRSEAVIETRGSSRTPSKFSGGCVEPRESPERPKTFDHWITSSARSSSDCGIVTPSAFAVLRLITSSNFVGCSIGISAGFAPRRILSSKMK